MKHDERLQLYRGYMASIGIKSNVATPVIWEFFWSHGMEIAPPPFIPTAVLAMIYIPLGALLPLIIGVLSVPLGRHFYFPPWNVIEFMVVASALVIGVGTPLYYRNMARKCGLGSWLTFIGHRQRPLP